MFLAISFISSDFVEKIIEKYTIELILTLFIARGLSIIINSKFYLLMLYISKMFSSSLFIYLYSKVLNHKIFNSIYELKTKKFLRYVKNDTNRKQLEFAIDATLINFLTKETFLTAVNINTLFFSTKNEFISILRTEIETARNEQTASIRQLVNEKKVHSLFANRYLAWTDMIYQCCIDRVKELQISNFNNYKIFIQFLYIISDMIVIYMDHVALNVNVFKIPEIKQKKGEETNGKPEPKRRNSKNSKKTV
jgi:hypothetical protein